MNYVRFFPFIKHLHSFSSSFHSPWASHPVANYIKKNYLCIFTYISIFLCFNLFNIQCYCYLILHPLLSLVSAIHFSLRGIYAHWFNSQKHVYSVLWLSSCKSLINILCSIIIPYRYSVFFTLNNDRELWNRLYKIITKPWAFLQSLSINK